MKQIKNCREQRPMPDRTALRNASGWLGLSRAGMLLTLGLSVGLSVGLTLTAALPAAAHHLMDGKVPPTGWAGFLSGLAHPIIGLDHLAFVVAIGLLAIPYCAGSRLVLSFGLGALLGTGLHLMQWDLPLAEVAIALSVLAAGALLGLGQRLPFGWALGLAATAGGLHGYAYGEAIVGAAAAPLVAYLLGFSLIQSLIAIGVMNLGRRGLAIATRWGFWQRSVGWVIAAIGGVFLANALPG